VIRIFFLFSNRLSDGWKLFVGGNLLKPYRVKNIVPYPQVKYNQFLYNNDIALIELSEPLVFSRNVSAVCLPSQSLQVNHTFFEIFILINGINGFVKIKKYKNSYFAAKTAVRDGRMGIPGQRGSRLTAVLEVLARSHLRFGEVQCDQSLCWVHNGTQHLRWLH